MEVLCLPGLGPGTPGGYLQGGLAGAAEAGDLKTVGLDGEGSLGGEALTDLQDVAAVELDDPATIRTNHVIMGSCAKAVFVIGAVVANEGAAQDASVHQERQGPINSCLPYPDALLAE